MRIGFVGAGKLGLPVSVTIALKGHTVLAFDTNKEKVKKYRRGIPDTGSYEPNLEGQLHEALRSGNLMFCNTLKELWDNVPSIIFIAVPTPSKEDNSFDTSYIKQTLRDLDALPRDDGYFPVISIISTILPMTVRTELSTLTRYPIVYNPFFIAMSTVCEDYRKPEFVLLGYENTGATTSKERSVMTEFYKEIYADEAIEPPLLHMTWEDAEICKTTYNTMIGAKIIIGNTIMEMCHHIPYANCDTIIDAFKHATKRIVGTKYLRGGMPDAGLCVKPGVKVLTDKGYIKIENIEVNNRVIGHDGKYHKVIKTFCRNYEGGMIKIEPTGFSDYPIVVTPEHPIFVGKRILPGEKRFYYVEQAGNRNPKKLCSFFGFNQYEFIFAKEVEKGDGLCLPLFNENNLKIDSVPLDVSKYDRRRGANQLPSTVPINEETMYLFGWYLAEGHAEERRTGFALHHKEEPYADEIARILKKHLGISSSKSIRDHHNLVLRLSSRPVNRFLRDTFGNKAWEKQVPWDWLQLDKNLLQALLRGLWYGDGGLYKNEYYLQITSEQLYDFVKVCLLKLGIPFRTKKYDKRVGTDKTPHRESYWIGTKYGYGMEKILPDFVCLEKGKLKRIMWFENNKMLYSAKNVLSEQYSGPVYNLEVEDVNSYVLEGGIVHNCHPRDGRALGYLCNKLGLSANIFDFIMETRELQTEWLAYLLWEAELPAVILGKRFKAGSSLTDDSGSILVHDIMENLGVEVHYHDPMLNLEYYPSTPHVFLVAIDEPWTRNYPYPSGSVVFDVWRQFTEADIELLEVRGIKYIPIGRNQP